MSKLYNRKFRRWSKNKMTSKKGEGWGSIPSSTRGEGRVKGKVPSKIGRSGIQKGKGFMRRFCWGVGGKKKIHQKVS